jgi:hypothetical protein
MKIKLISIAIRGFYEKCTKTIENTDFLTLRFLHIKYNKRKTSKNE